MDLLQWNETTDVSLNVIDVTVLAPFFMSSFNLDDELAFLEASGHADLDRDETEMLQQQLITSPLLNFASLRHHAEAFPSRGLLGTTTGERFYMNTNTPSSGVICGVQVSLV